MSRSFSLQTVSLALGLAMVIGTAMLGVLAATSPAQPVTAFGALTVLAKQVLAIVAFGYLVGALTWAVVFWLRRDGWHRMEWIALQPRNYGGRDPFDISKAG